MNQTPPVYNYMGNNMLVHIPISVFLKTILLISLKFHYLKTWSINRISVLMTRSNYNAMRYLGGWAYRFKQGGLMLINQLTRTLMLINQLTRTLMLIHLLTRRMMLINLLTRRMMLINQ